MNQFILPIRHSFFPGCRAGLSDSPAAFRWRRDFQISAGDPAIPLSITDNNKIKLEQFPLNDMMAEHTVSCPKQPASAALRTKYGITVLDLEKKRKWLSMTLG